MFSYTNKDVNKAKAKCVEAKARDMHGHRPKAKTENRKKLGVNVTVFQFCVIFAIMVTMVGKLLATEMFEFSVPSQLQYYIIRIPWQRVV